MSQILTVQYKNGHSRRINLTQEFFKSEESVAKRALDIAYQYDLNPTYVTVVRGDRVIYENRLKHNDNVYGKVAKVDERDIKKMLRKEFKNKPLRKVSFEQLNDMTNWGK